MNLVLRRFSLLIILGICLCFEFVKIMNLLSLHLTRSNSLPQDTNEANYLKTLAQNGLMFSVLLSFGLELDSTG